MNSRRAHIILTDLVKLHLPGWTVEMNSKLTSLGGRCNNGLKRIQLSTPNTILRKESAVIETILHEIAHGLSKKRGHGREWAMICAQLGGCPTPCYDLAEEKEAAHEAK